MSIDATVARVAQLEAMLGLSPAGAPVSTPPTTTGTSSTSSSSPTSFAAQLASLAGTPATAATSDPSLTNAPAATTGATPTGATSTGTPGAATPFAAEIDAAAKKYGVDSALLRGLIRQESNFNANATSPAGARGMTQLMPGTAAALGVNPAIPAQAIEGGAKYLRQQLDKFGGDPEKALAAYNAGPGAVQRYGGVPPFAETQNYVRKVMAYAAEYRKDAPSASASAASAVAASAPTTAPAATAAGQVGTQSALPYSTT
jgi:soluble lytic murein transglycosylase-like protein